MGRHFNGKRWMGTWLLGLLAAGAFAQDRLPALDAASLAQSRDQREARQQLIDRLRAGENAQLDAEAQACSRQFAVSACTREVELRRKAMLTRYKREENALNDMERRQRAQEQQQKTREKLQEKARQDAQTAAEQPRQQFEDKAAEQVRKQEDNAASRKRRPASAPAAVPGGISAEAQARNREAYASKQLEAQKRQEELAKRLREKPSSAKPLPANPPPIQP